MNSIDQIKLHENTNETVKEDIYTNMETFRTDDNDRKQQGGKLPGKSFFSENETLYSVYSFSQLLIHVFWN